MNAHHIAGHAKHSVSGFAAGETRGGYLREHESVRDMGIDLPFEEPPDRATVSLTVFNSLERPGIGTLLLGALSPLTGHPRVLDATDSAPLSTPGSRTFHRVRDN